MSLPQPSRRPPLHRVCQPTLRAQTHTRHTQSKDRGSLPRVYGSSTATDMLGTRVHQLRISKFIGMPSGRRRNCQSQKLVRVQSARPVTATLTSRGRNDIALWRKLARPRRTYLSVGPEGGGAAAAAASIKRQGRASRGVTAMHPTSTNDPTPTTLPRPGWNNWRPSVGARLSCRQGRQGPAKEALQHVIAEIWNVDLKPNAQAF